MCMTYSLATKNGTVDNMNINSHVDILMSTYNGSRYVAEQIESIINQDYKNWTLLIKDDGSSDSTVDIVCDFARKDQRIKILADDGKNIGPALSFMNLLAQSKSPYFMFSDQDDFWLPSKISLTLAEFRRKENNSDVPMLVFTDLQVVGENLELISPSFLRYQRISHAKSSSFRRELLQNIVTGCAMGGNAALRRKGLAVMGGQAVSMIMHDWWLALVAYYFGSVSFIPDAPILYRQHSNNQLGAKGSGLFRYLAIAKSTGSLKRIESYLNKVSIQNKLFAETFSDQIQISDRELLTRIAGFENNWTATALIGCFARGAAFKTFDCSLAFLYGLLLHNWLSAGNGKNKCELRS